MIVCKEIKLALIVTDYDVLATSGQRVKANPLALSTCSLKYYHSNPQLTSVLSNHSAAGWLL
jgi:hypothetical protein